MSCQKLSGDGVSCILDTPGSFGIDESPMQETNMHGADLEQRIDYQALRLHTAATPNERRSAWDELRRLHALRTPERVEQMEREIGVR